ncbi:DegT/DnrJ/EryC1/StrS family aminotransferase [Winogradskyella eckloniae]|uniref:DegT/DnrJ/EryC1/StrS family aminotransferase n=1 Tax=Winogradskyella eckloniae TaxID=1089306 RepID=UPI001565D0D8|nr:DegT/DnrJ/EryC1/StrS family aminotransferase [Winogradskyella eckloniae]NRD20805.1 DegT/DnrJ/EryC1/StrS family aminotransferase [Winogradskyella eckloniae]
MIPVTKPFLPPKAELYALLDEVYDRNWLTNSGPLVNLLESEIPKFLNYNGHFSYVNNGTIAIQIAIKALELTGDIITTPFSYVATTSSIVWEGCKPVFVDIEEGSCNIDPRKIEAAITPTTTGILATHVYGNPCDVEAIAAIAKKHNLKVIYDAAHCFGTTYKGKSIFEYGDISTTSFHATKLFHTVEGGALFTNTKAVAHKINYMRNFGHNGQEDFWGIGINGKNSEFHAAMGIANLKHMGQVLEKRKAQWLLYRAQLGKHYDTLDLIDETGFNYSYFPIFFKSEKDLLAKKKLLDDNHIYCRRYFYPSLNTLNYTKTDTILEVSEQRSKTVLTLPLYDKLSEENQFLIVKNILS